MANRPVSRSGFGPASRPSMGPKLLGAGVGLFLLTRIVVWLPLGFVGTAVNSILWPVLLLSLATGAGLTYLSRKRS